MLIKQDEDGSSWHIVFKHTTATSSRHTICKIIRRAPAADGMPVSETLMGVGAAFCNPKDIFRKEAGRVLSLQRALLSFPKEFRTQAWAAYWNRGQRNEADFIAAYVQDGENMSYDEARNLAEARDREAADGLMASISRETANAQQ